MGRPWASVQLVSMPFGQVTLPSLGLSLLRAGLRSRGIQADLRYLQLDFAQRVGLERYEEVIDQDQSRLLGEWVFHPSLYGAPSPERVERYWSTVYPPPVHRGAAALTRYERLKEDVARMQEEATRFIEELAEALPWGEARLVGFSTTFHQSVASLALARRIKERSPGTRLVLGGANCEGEMGLALLRNFPFLDFVFSGEADSSFPPFVEEVLAGGEPSARAGLIRREPSTGEALRPASWVDPVADLDALPVPEHDDYFAQAEPLVRQHGRRFQVTLPFETARGCWWGQKHHCTFCGLNGSTMAFRSKSVPRAIEEVSGLLDRYGERVQRIQAVDNILDMRYFTGFLPALARHPIKRPCFYEVKSNLSREQVYALAEARVMDLQPGIESLSTHVLGLMRKGVTALRNVQLLKWCSEAGIRPAWNVIYGFPREERAEYEAMARLIPRLRHLQPPVGYSQLRLDRFSPYFGDPASFGMVATRPCPAYACVYPLPEEELRELAYYFEFDYEDGRSLDYVQELVERCREWTGAGGTATLAGFDDGERLLVWDTRPMARATWTSLRGLHRAALRACDAITSRATLQRQLQEWAGGPLDEAVVEAVLEELEARGLLLREGPHLLGLVVLPPRARAPSLPAQVITELSSPTVHVARSTGAGTQGEA